MATDPNKPYDPKAPENRYDKMLFHDTHTAAVPVYKVVKNKDEHDALGPEWHEAPPEVPTAPRVDASTLAAENAALKAKLDELTAANKAKAAK